MYYYLNGTLAELMQDKAVIDCGGVGYLVTISGKTYESIARMNAFDPSGNVNPIKVKVFTHHVVKEDAQELYGFASREECEIFKCLISVSGLGPKGAVAILSTLSTDRLVAAVASDDARAISASPGIGLKTAQKIIIELKDKLAKKLEFSSGQGLADETFVAPSKGSDADDAVDALVVLGYSKNEAARAVAKCKSQSLENIIREALSLLSKR